MKIMAFWGILLCLPVLRSAAQDIDSLGKIIDGVISHPSKQSLNPGSVISAGISDTVTINLYLNEADKYRHFRSDSFNILNQKALEVSLGAGSLRHISLCMQNLGSCFMWKEDYTKATSCFLTCLRIEEKRGDLLRTAVLDDELGSVYYYLEMFEKSLNYSQKALDIFERFSDTLKTALVLRHLGSLHSSREFCEKRTELEKQGDFALAIRYFMLSAELYGSKNDLAGIADCNVNIGAVFNKMDKPDKAEEYIGKALVFFRSNQDWNRMTATLYTLGKTYFKAKEYEKSVACFAESEKIAKQSGYTDGIQFLYEALAQTYHAQKDYKNAYTNYIRYMTLRDSVYNAEKAKQAFELETKYQSQVKENEILNLTLQQKHKNQIIFSLAGLIFILFISGYYIIRMNRKNKVIAGQTIEIKEKKIRELEKERQLIAAKSVLQGEEDERSRIASDLHDGLGGLLSGVKINLSTMKENAILTHENVSAFSHAISLLDTSISELKRIAHNLMPETLHNQGIKFALEDFCVAVQPAGDPKINLSFYGSELRYSKELELTVYRIAQELVNNALKHGEASNIQIQLFAESNRICLEVADNGKGFTFDPDARIMKGSGLNNIRSRVNALGGKFDCWSRPGEGTEITVEFEVT